MLLVSSSIISMQEKSAKEGPNFQDLEPLPVAGVEPHDEKADSANKWLTKKGLSLEGRRKSWMPLKANVILAGGITVASRLDCP